MSANDAPVMPQCSACNGVGYVHDGLELCKRCDGSGKSSPLTPSVEATGREMDKRTTGLYSKFLVTRTDGKSEPGQKHEGCEYFVLDLDHDPHAYAALRAYRSSCRREYPKLAEDLLVKVMTKSFGGLVK